MWFRQTFWGSTPPEYSTDVVSSNIWRVYTPRIYDGCGSVKYLGGQYPPNVSLMGFRQIIRGSTPPKYFTDGVPSNVWGVYTPIIFDRFGSVKYLGAVHPQNISRMWFRQILGGSTPPKYFTDGVPSNIWGVYTPKIFDGCGFVKYLGGLHPQNICRIWFRQIFGGSTPPKYFTDGVSSNVLGGRHPQNISRMWFRQILGGSTPPKYFTDGVPSNIWGVYTPRIFDGCGPVKYLGGLHPQNI